MSAVFGHEAPEERAKSYTVSLTPLLREQAEKRVKSLRPKVSGFSNYVQQLIAEDLSGTRFDPMRLYRLLEPVHTQMNVVMEHLNDGPVLQKFVDAEEVLNNARQILYLAAVKTPIDRGLWSIPSSIGAAVRALLVAKDGAGRSGRYTTALRVVLGHLTRGREQRPISDVTADELAEFLAGRPVASAGTYRARLSTLFRYALRMGWVSSNPVERIETPRATARLPVIMTPEQVAVALCWLQANPRALGWFVLSTFCGLRPEEAERTPWAAVDVEAGCIRVEASTSKIRQRRVVYPLPEAIAWLRTAREAGADLPIPSIARRRAVRSLREVMGWAVWPKDVTRHTAASYWLARVEDAAAVAEQLGHDVRTMRRHYRAAVTREDAERFWRIRPETKHPAEAG